RTVRVGLQTSDDTRFVRAWWEVAPERIVTGTPETTPEGFRRQTFAGKCWVPFAKGGEYSPYYADLHLVVNWERDGEELRAFSRSVIRNPDLYFRPGLTWPLRTTSGISFRVLPSGSIFSNKGPTVFLPNPLLVLGIVQSMPFSAIIQLQVGAADKAARSYEVGVIRNCPITLVERVDPRIQELVRESIDLKRKMALTDETTHVFCRPSVLMLNGPNLVTRAVKWTTLAGEWTRRLS